jgi:hypothetical protein
MREIEARSILKSGSERSSLVPESQSVQDAVEAVLFRYYGLSDNDAHYIEKRLGEML